MNKQWKAKLESAYSFMLKYSKITVCSYSSVWKAYLTGNSKCTLDLHFLSSTFLNPRKQLNSELQNYIEIKMEVCAEILANIKNDDFICTGKSFSEALILASTNPQYDKRLFIDIIKSIYSEKATKF